MVYFTFFPDYLITEVERLWSAVILRIATSLSAFGADHVLPEAVFTQIGRPTFCL